MDLVDSELQADFGGKPRYLIEEIIEIKLRSKELPFWGFYVLAKESRKLFQDQKLHKFKRFQKAKIF